MSDLALFFVLPVLALAFAGRLVAADSTVARRKLEDSGTAPWSPPPSLRAAAVSFCVTLAAAAFLILLAH